MNYVDHILLSRFYQIAKISTFYLDTIINQTSNNNLKTLISNQLANYDVITNECNMLAKAHSVTLPDHTFFKRCKQIIEDNFSTISATPQIIIASTTMLNLSTLIEIYNVESADSETIRIGKHLQSMQENNLQILQQIK